MSPEEKAQLRHLMRLSRQLPQPKSELLQRATKRRSVAAQRMPTITQQAQTEIKTEQRAEQAAEERVKEKTAKQLEQKFKTERSKAAEKFAKEDFEAKEAILAATQKGSADRRKAMFDLTQTIKQRRQAEKEIQSEEEKMLKSLRKKKK